MKTIARVMSLALVGSFVILGFSNSVVANGTEALGPLSGISLASGNDIK